MHQTKYKKHEARISERNIKKSNKHKTIKKLTPKADVCTYKKHNGSINVSKYIGCIPNDTLRSQVGKPKHIYEINDNAACPFVVFDYGAGRAAIYNNRYNESTNRGELKGKLMDVVYEELFLGDNGTNDPYWRRFERGNNILLKTGKGKYLFIGKGILSFSAKNGDTMTDSPTYDAHDAHHPVQWTPDHVSKTKEVEAKPLKKDVEKAKGWAGMPIM